jgi:hypothetical protein
VQFGLQASAVFPDAAATVHPSALAGQLEVSAFFNPVGFMMPDVR